MYPRKGGDTRMPQGLEIIGPILLFVVALVGGIFIGRRSRK